VKQDDDELYDRSEQLENEVGDDSDAYKVDDNELEELLDEDGNSEPDELHFDEDFDRCTTCGETEVDDMGMCVNGCDDEEAY